LHTDLTTPRTRSFPTRRSSDLQHAHGVGHLSADVVDLAGARVVFHVAARARAPQLERGVLAVGEGEGEAHDVSVELREVLHDLRDRKSTRLNSSHDQISYAVFC